LQGFCVPQRQSVTLPQALHLKAAGLKDPLG
jgi:hypothetical protein